MLTSSSKGQNSTDFTKASGHGFCTASAMNASRGRYHDSSMKTPWYRNAPASVAVAVVFAVPLVVVAIGVHAVEPALHRAQVELEGNFVGAVLGPFVRAHAAEEPLVVPGGLGGNVGAGVWRPSHPVPRRA